MLLLSRCAITLAVLGLLVLPFTTRSGASLVVDLLGIGLSLALVVLTSLIVHWNVRHGSMI